MSRNVHLDEGCTLRFPHRDESFASGVEVGILAAQMDAKPDLIRRWIATSNVDQLQALAEQLGYRLLREGEAAQSTMVTLRRADIRPRLRVIRSR